VPDSDANPATAEAPASLAEAEEEVSRAEARAAAARARAAELRRQVQRDADETEPTPAKSKRWRAPRPGRTAARICAAIVICASLAASGYMVWQHFSLLREHRHAAEFAAAARSGIELMMSIDPDHARDNVQRTIDATTGALKSQLEATSSYMVKSAEDAKITTKASVQDTAVESVSDNSAVVLVVAKSDTTNADKSKRPPVFWRLSVNIDRDGGQLKMSKVDFVK
jgi:Mce-associated membrane protein